MDEHLWTSIYRLALRLLPAALRRKHGPAMEALFARELGRARESGQLRGALAGATGVWDAVQRGVYERVREGRDSARVRPDGYRRERWNMDALRRDLAYSLRSLLRAPRFTATVVLTLALGMGATSAVFSVVDAVLVRPLPFPNADRVVNVTWEGGGYLQRLTAGVTTGFSPLVNYH